MITLHKLGRGEERFLLNPDLIVSIQATPDTVITLAGASKVVVEESPEQIAWLVRQWRAQVLHAAIARPAEPSIAPGEELEAQIPRAQSIPALITR